MLEAKSVTKPHQNDQREPLVVPENVVADMAASGYEFEPHAHPRTKSISELYGGMAAKANVARSHEPVPSEAKYGVVTSAWRGVMTRGYHNLLVEIEFFA